MKKGVVQTKFWKRGLAATLAAAMLCGNFLEVGSSLKVFAEDGVASNAGVTVNIDTDFSTLTLENVPSNVDIPLNIQVDEAELTAKTENLEEEQKSAAQNAYQAEMQAGFEQKLNELLEGKSVVDYTGAQDAPNIGVVTAVSFDENGSVDDISFIGVNTGAESREITVSLTHPIEVDKAASGLQTVELDAQLNLDAFKEEEAPDNGDQSESETETPDNGDQSESETETPDNGDQTESETEAPDNGDQSESETETPDNGDQSESETETPDNGDQSEGDESNSKNQELTPDSTPAGVANQSASYSELTDHFSVGTNDDLSNLEDPDKETTPPEEPEISDDMPKNYWNISANPKVNEGTISFTEAISPAANFAVEEASDTVLISALSFMVPGESIAQATPKKGDSSVTITKWVVDENGHEVEDNTEFTFYLSGDNVSEDTQYTVNGHNDEKRYVKEDDDGNLYITLKNGETAKFPFWVVNDDLTVTEKETDDYKIRFEYDKEEHEPDLDDADHFDNKAELKKHRKHVTFYNVSGGSSGGSGEIKPPEVIREPKVSALKEIDDAGRREAGIYPITLTVDGVSGNEIITEEMPLNVLLVWDASSSMDSSKWESLTTASSNIAQVVLGEENTQNQMAIDVYSRTAAHLQAWTKNLDKISDLCDKNREAICGKASIATNGTNCEQGAVIAGTTLDSLTNSNNAVNVVVYLSDGEPYQYGDPAQDGNKSEAERQAKKAIQELQERTDSTLYTVGIGNFNSTVLSAAGNGYFLGNHEASKLTEIFQEIVKITRNIPVVNYNVSVTDPMSEHVNITKADGKVIEDTNYNITNADSRANWLNAHKGELGLTFTYQGYQKNDDGTLKLDEQGKPIKDTANTAHASSSGIDGNFPDITTYEQLLEQVTFSASNDIVQLIWTPGDQEQFLDGEYTLTYTVNVKADQDNFENNNNYPANGTTVVSGQYKSGDTITPANPKELAPVQVYQEQNTLTIKKTGTDDKTLEGAEFVVSFTDDAGNTKYLAEDHSGSSAVYTDIIDSAQHFTTSEDGTVTIEGLYDYVYTVEEVEAPSGYSKLGQSFTVDFTGKEGKTASGTVKQDGTVDGSLNTDNSTGEVTVQNAPSTGSITVNKVLKDANDQLIQSTNNPAFKVKLTKDNDPNFIAQTEELTWINNTYNTVTFNNLEAGTYTITEYLADDTLASSKYDVTVTASGSPVTNGQVALNGGPTVDVTITNTEKANGSITVTKELKGYNGGTPSSTDKTFYVALYKGDATTPVTDATVTKNGSTVTNNNGVYEIKANETLTFSKLPYGTYTVKEVTEDGDELGSDFDYTVTDSGTPVTLNVNNTTDNVIITNTEKNNGQISVTKTVTEPTGSVTPAPLNGDEVFYVALYQGDGTTPVTNATVKNGEESVAAIADGIYEIKDGETLTFSDLPYGNYIVKEVVKNGNNWVEVDNNDKNFDFTVTYNTQNINVHNSQVNEVTITNTRKVEGSIVLRKVIAVLSNVPDDDKTFTFQITGGGITAPISVTVEPDSATGALQEVDLLQALKDAGVTEIYGTEFTITEILQDSDNYTLESIGSTSEAKPNTSTGLKGFLEALLAPRNADPSCTFTPERNKSITITATNTAKTGSIEINKVDNVGNALPGVTFGLYTDVNATTPFTQNGTQVTATTDDNGTVRFDEVPVGTYYLKETAVPAGYTVSDVIFEVTVTSGTTTKVTENMISSGNAEFTDNDKLINTPTAITPEIKVTKAAATGDEAFIKADNKEYTVQITGNESSEAVTLNNAKGWTGTISDFALMPNVKYTVSETVPEGAHWALDNIAITFKDSSGNTVDENNAFTLKPEQASKVTSIDIVVTNKAKRSEVQLEVTEQVIGNLLEAEKNTFNFTVTGPDGTFTGLVTVNDGNVTKVSGWDAGSAEVTELPKLIPGETYTITQTSNPEYLLNDINEDLEWNGASELETRKFTFKVPEDAKGTYTVAFTNYANTIPVTLTKVLEDNARPLNPDDKFDFDITTIQDNGHAFTTAAAVTTTNSATFNLIKGKTYTIKEVAIPDGYQLVSIAMNGEVLPSTKDVNPSYSFTIPTDAAEIKLVATNRILGSYDFIKMGKVTTITQRPNGTVISRTETTNPLAGATFTLKDEDGVLLQTVESAADGKVSFNNLPAGEYIIEEASAPSGFNKWNYQIDLTLSIDDGDMIINAEPTDDRGTEVKDYMLYIYNYREDIITEQDPPIPPTDPEDPGDPRPSGGGDETTTRTIEDTPTPTTTIEDEDVPLAPLPNDMITIEDEDVPLGDLPYTGGLPFELVGVLGIALVGAGLVLRKKNKKD